VYNVGGEKAVSIRALAEMVRSALGMKVEIVVKQKPARDVPASVYVPVVDRAKDELGLQVRTPLECAVRKSAAFDAAVEGRINA
jgi:dTDP-glucose 4,6-dehydratase